ncbi:hypothetical protein EB001_01545 [bacterium]|nr:hypothetical protein [bacterium]
MTDQPKPNLEQDLYNSDYIRNKARGNDAYCQHLYAALCNNEFIKAEVLTILAAEHWSCSWRHAGGIGASLYDGSLSGDYMRYYVSNMEDNSSYVSEATITEEIREDFKKLGWYVVENTVEV